MKVWWEGFKAFSFQLNPNSRFYFFLIFKIYFRDMYINCSFFFFFFFLRNDFSAKFGRPFKIYIYTHTYIYIYIHTHRSQLLIIDYIYIGGLIGKDVCFVRFSHSYTRVRLLLSHVSLLYLRNEFMLVWLKT